MDGKREKYESPTDIFTNEELNRLNDRGVLEDSQMNQDENDSSGEEDED